MHGPLEAPPEYETPLPNDPRGARAKMNAMAAILDEGIANVTDALRQSCLYENTLIVVSSDNGGWIQLDHGGNNFPLRGGKTTDFEGGVRTAAFVSGGFLEQMAPNLLGSRSNLLMHLVDWYDTLIEVGTSISTRITKQDHRESQDVPPVDSLNVWEALISNDDITAVRTEVPLSFCSKEAACDWPGGSGNAALISWPWKVINGTQVGLGFWQGPQFPNASKKIPQPSTDYGCPEGCLFNIETDPTEHQEVKEKHPEIFARLWSRLLEIGQGVYQTNYDGGAKTCLPVEEAYRRDKGFLAPRCVVEDEGQGQEAVVSIES
ncbi:MAG: hypothetical protein SGILL_000065 [Bacillariaceae sp.]